VQRNLCKEIYAKVTLQMADGKSDPVPNPPGAEKRRRAPVEPAALKAFAHPLRMAMYTELQRQGSATASQLARSLG